MYIMHVQAPIMNNRVEKKGFSEECNSNRLGGKPYEAFTIGVSIDFCGTNLKLAADLYLASPRSLYHIITEKINQHQQRDSMKSVDTTTVTVATSVAVANFSCNNASNTLLV
jgi:hypothetical protein